MCTNLDSTQTQVHRVVDRSPPRRGGIAAKEGRPSIVCARVYEWAIRVRTRRKECQNKHTHNIILTGNIRNILHSDINMKRSL